MERDDSQERKGLYKLAVTLALGGPLSEAQRQELLAVARKCPVHKLMAEVTTEISTELATAFGREDTNSTDHSGRSA